MERPADRQHTRLEPPARTMHEHRSSRLLANSALTPQQRGLPGNGFRDAPLS